MQTAWPVSGLSEQARRIHFLSQVWMQSMDFKHLSYYCFLSVFDSRQCVLLNCVSCTNGSLHRLLGESAAMVFTNIVSVVGWQRRRTAPSTWRSGTSPTQRSYNRLRCRSASHDYITIFIFNFDYPLYASSTLFVFKKKKSHSLFLAGNTQKGKMTPPRIELGIYRVSGDRVSHCTTESNNFLIIFYYFTAANQV